MRSVQREVRKPVVEALLVDVDDVHVATFMIGMAACAVESLRFGKPAVQAGLLRKVAANFGMANDAQFALWLIGQRCMAGTAFRLDVCMTGDDRSGHDQPFFDL